MDIKSFPFCCTAKIILDFGESRLSEGGAQLNTVASIKKYIKNQIKSFYNSGMAVFVAITNNEQVNANIALEQTGFLSSGWMGKKQHPESRIKLWWKPHGTVEVTTQEENEDV